MSKIIRTKTRAEGGITEEEVIKITKQIFLALNYMHQNNIMHRDIKPENILVRFSDKRRKRRGNNYRGGGGGSGGARIEQLMLSTVPCFPTYPFLLKVETS